MPSFLARRRQRVITCASLRTARSRVPSPSVDEISASSPQDDPASRRATRDASATSLWEGFSGSGRPGRRGWRESHGNDANVGPDEISSDKKSSEDAGCLR